MTQFQKHSISRKIKGISIIAASATALTLTGIGAAGAADGRAPLHTIAPDLRSVSVQSSHPDGNDPELVRYCFDKHLDQLSGAGGFALSGPDSRQPVTAQRVTRDVDDLSCAVAEYAPHTDVRTYTLGVVADDAVRDVQHNGNVEDSAALDGVAANAVPAPGRTSAPDLVGTEKDDTLNRIGFVFDERLAAPGANRSQAGSDQARRNPAGLRLLDLSRGLAGIITSQDNRMGRAFQAASYDPSAFGYYTLNGIAHRGQRIVAAPDGDRITIQFADGDHVSDAVRYFVDQAAVADNSGHANPEGASGAGTTRPDLVAVSHVAGSQTQFDYTFSEAVVNPDATFFTVYTQDATRYQGSQSSRPGPTVVRVTFPAVKDFSNQIVLGTARIDRMGGAAVRAENSPTSGNTVGVSALRSDVPAGAGHTDGPDLRGATYDGAVGQVTYTFDQAVDDDQPGSIDAGRYHIVDTNGRRSAATQIIDVNGDHVTVRFPDASAVQAATGAFVDANAIRDYQGNPNPVAATGGGPADHGQSTD